MTKKQQKLLHLGIIGLIVIISFFAWNTFLVYPLKLFVVLVHEISHGLVAVLTGGRIIEISLTEYLGGLTTTQGGNTFLVASAGYLGSSALGSLLFYSSFDKNVSVWFTTGLAILLLIFAANFISGTIGQVVAVISALILVVSPRFFNPVINKIILQSLGLLSAFYVLIDIKEDLLSGVNYQTDTAILENVTKVPSELFAVIWLIISGMVIYFLVRKLLKN